MSQENALPTPTPSRSRDRELWVGVFVILGLVAILTALYTLTDAALFRGRYIIQTVVPDAGGIRRGDPVQMRGVNIGRVSSFHIVSDGVEVDLEIEGRYPIPTDSQVELRSGGLLGGMVANVIPGVAAQDVGWSDALPGSIGKGIFDQIDVLQEQADKALTRVQRLLDEKTIQNVHEGGDDLRQLLRRLNEMTAEQRDEFTALTRSLRRTAESLEQTATGPEIDRSVKRIDALTGQLDSLVSTLDQSARSAQNVLARIDRGEGSLGKLTRDEALYDNATAAAASLKQAADELANLAEDIRNQPGKYVQVSVF